MTISPDARIPVPRPGGNRRGSTPSPIGRRAPVPSVPNRAAVTALAVLLAALPLGVGADAPLGFAALAGQEDPERPSGATAALARTVDDALGDSVQLVDRVVAIVGDTSLLLSDVQQEVFRMRQQGLELPRDPFRLDSLMRQTLQNLIDRTLLLQRAKQEGIRVPGEDVEAEADDRLDQIRSSFRSDRAFREAVERSGQNMFQYRQMLQTRIREEMTLARFRQLLITESRLPSASVSEGEIRDFFQRNAASATRPAAVSFRRILVAPEPSEAAADSARNVAREALEEIHAGTAFEVAARRYSDDPGTRDSGGELGWIRRNDVVPAFAEAAWRAPPGRAVGPVETRFGYHLIKVTNTRGGERQLRHVLIRPRITEEDVAAAEERAAALADSLRAGADASRLAREHGLRDEQVRFEEVPLQNVESRLGEPYRRILEDAREGDVLGPLRMQGALDLPNFAVLRVTDYRPPGPYRLEDVHNDIRQRLLREKQFDRYLKQLRSRMHVEILI